MMTKLTLLTLDEALRQASQEDFVDARRPDLQFTRRPPAPSLACLPPVTREYVLPPQLLPGPFSILLV